MAMVVLRQVHALGQGEGIALFDGDGRRSFVFTPHPVEKNKGINRGREDDFKEQGKIRQRILGNS